VSRARGNGAVKAKRQQALLSLLARDRLGSQEEIRTRLATLGIDATQSTISRDVEELGLARVHDAGGVRYVVPGSGGGDGRPAPTGRLRHLLDEFELSRTRADHALVIRTPPGAAAAVAEAIDRVGLEEVAGTVAGDDTILVVGREGVSSARLQRAFDRIVGGAA
jgi:transcriptional regulator of arginine metabolism